jgi:hypothetical protein
VEEAGDPGQRGDLRILPDAKIAGGDAALGENGGGLENDQACATLGAATEVNKMPLAGKAVHGGVLAHGRDADAVGKADRTELQRRKKRMAHALMDAGERGEIQRKTIKDGKKSTWWCVGR